MPKFNNGKIAVRPHQKQLKTADGMKLYGEGTAILDSEASRSTEDDALKNLRPVPQLNQLQREIALLERLGRDPKLLPDYPTRERYKIAIYGKALWAWIGLQPGITLRAKEVEQHLKDISSILQRRAEMGADDK